MAHYLDREVDRGREADSTSSRPPARITAVSQACTRLSGLSTEDVDEADVLALLAWELVSLGARSLVDEAAWSAQLKETGRLSLWGSQDAGVSPALLTDAAPGRIDDPALEILALQANSVLQAVRTAHSARANFAQTVEALVTAIEKKDRYTGGHTKRVVYYSEKIARELGLTEARIEKVKLGASLHDVGKIGIEDQILRKPDALDEYEQDAMSKHPEHGTSILAGVTGMSDAVAGMRFHHERWDGTGYPEGLKGREIPWVARIVAVADAYDAMTSHRPYRRALAREIAFQEIRSKGGTQFCPEVVAAFCRAFGGGIEAFEVDRQAASGHHGEHVLVR